MKERPKILTTLKFNSLKKHETLSKKFAVNKKRKDTSDFNRDNIDWSMPYDVKLSTPTTVVTSVFQSDNSLSDGKHACPMDPSIGSIGQSDFATTTKHAACTHP